MTPPFFTSALGLYEYVQHASASLTPRKEPRPSMGNMLPCSYKGFGSGRCEGKENLCHHVFAVVQLVETMYY